MLFSINTESHSKLDHLEYDAKCANVSGDFKLVHTLHFLDSITLFTNKTHYLSKTQL
jgi:hypothetical protein